MSTWKSLKWKTATEAYKWPEGCSVMWRIPIGLPGRKFDYEHHSYHRPDFMIQRHMQKYGFIRTGDQHP
jgi:hypothetical protein